MHFFDRYVDGGFTHEAIASYHAYFPRLPGHLAGEWTPRYMYDVWVPKLLHAAAPNARILVLLRDPVERYRSGLAQYPSGLALEASGTAATDALLRAADGIARGFYWQQLQRVFRYFDRAQVLVLQYERCCSQPLPELARTWRFLGLDDSCPAPEGVDRRVNKTEGVKVELTEECRQSLVEAYLDDTRLLLAAYPDFDVSLWPNMKAAM